MLHGCTVGDGCLVGMSSTLLDGAVLEPGCFLGAGSLVTPGTVLPGGMLCHGRPARPVRPVDDAIRWWVETSAAHYLRLAARYGEVGLP